MQEVPDNVIAAVNALLAPYGQHYSPSAPAPAVSAGYLSPRKAAEFLGISRSSLYRLTTEGHLRPTKLGSARNSRIVYDKRSLDAYIASLS